MTPGMEPEDGSLRPRSLLLPRPLPLPHVCAWSLYQIHEQNLFKNHDLMPLQQVGGRVIISQEL